MTSIKLQSLEAKKTDELKGTLQMATHLMAMPLYLAFWVADLLYVPHLKWEFLTLRLSIIPMCLVLNKMLKKMTTYNHSQRVALIFTAYSAAVINAMIFIIGDVVTPYYAGLNLVSIGTLTFLPWSGLYFCLASGAIYLPYFLFLSLHNITSDQARLITLSLFFSGGTVIMAWFIRYFQEKLRISDYTSKTQLEKEIVGRDALITQKTDEAVRLAYLSSQFSPQVVDAIKNNTINLNSGIHRSQVCAIFIDICNSTERVTRLDKDKVHTVITSFMEDSIKVLLKYDITIDKFLGDGVLAFSNDPVQYTDYVDRVLFAALEIRRSIQAKQDFYERNWFNKLQIKVGIAMGFANVGFYGNDRYYKSYTAIGPVVNLASRLCSIAEPDQILISSDVFDNSDKNSFQANHIGKKTLKGFESDVIHTYELVGGNLQEAGVIDCPSCQKGIMYMDTNTKGIFVFRCRTCGFVDDGKTSAITKKAA